VRIVTESLRIAKYNSPVLGPSQITEQTIDQKPQRPPLTTDRIRVLVTDALGGYSRIAEIEAWGSEVSAGQ
jgi:hypothetical protein